MTKKNKAQSAGLPPQNQLILLGVAAVVILVGGLCFALTGADPLGLFSPTPTLVAEQPPASTPVPGQTPLPSLTPVAKQTSVPGGQGGTWWEVYFTDPNTLNNPDNLAGSIPEKLIARINQAQKSIHIAAFEFNLTAVAEALIAAHERGVDVKWFTDDENGTGVDNEKGRGQFAMLKKAGIPVKDDHRSALMHNKFWIFDDQVVWTGSTNITVNGNFHNNNNVIVMKSPELAAIYEREFEELWAGKSGPTSPSTLEQQSVTIEGTPVQILFAAEDKVIDHLIPLVEGAQKDIRFMAFSFTHEKLGQAVLARAKAGVDVKGIFETRGSETQYSELPPFYCAGLSVRQDGNPDTFHHKVFIIDDQIVVTGSLNFSQNADESNDENTVVLTNRDIAALYLQEFDRRWAEATEPKKSDMKCK